MLHDKFKMYNCIPNEIKNEIDCKTLGERCYILRVEKVGAIVEILVDKKYISEKHNIMLDFKNYYIM